MAVVLAGLLFSLSASAVITNPSCGVVPIQQLNYITTTQVDKFDSSLGQLQSVTVTVNACGRGSRTLTNEDQIPTGVDYTAILTANMISDIPGIGPQNFQIGTTDIFHLAPGGTHAITLSPACDNQSFTLTTPAEMAPYIGNAGDKVTIPVSTKSNIQVDGSTEWSSAGSTFMGVDDLRRVRIPAANMHQWHQDQRMYRRWHSRLGDLPDQPRWFQSLHHNRCERRLLVLRTDAWKL